MLNVSWEDPARETVGQRRQRKEQQTQDSALDERRPSIESAQSGRATKFFKAAQLPSLRFLKFRRTSQKSSQKSQHEGGVTASTNAINFTEFVSDWNIDEAIGHTSIRSNNQSDYRPPCCRHIESETETPSLCGRLSYY
jgi:hypothetical protein